MEENNFLKIEFDSSSLTAANISEEQFESGIQEKVQLILQKEFPETRLKQYIKKETTGINFACPICHDSAFDPRKKRGHIAFRGRHAGLYTCFNSCSSSLYMDTKEKRYQMHRMSFSRMLFQKRMR